jgi:hypothetical protein
MVPSEVFFLCGVGVREDEREGGLEERRDEVDVRAG